MDSDTIKVCVVCFITTLGSVAAAYISYLARRYDHNHSMVTRESQRPPGQPDPADRDSPGNS